MRLWKKPPVGVVLRHTKGILSYYKTGLTGGEMKAWAWLAAAEKANFAWVA
jgi:hypothetical protein